MTDNFDRAVASIARRKAIWFFAPRLTLIALGLAMALAALSGCARRTACVDGKLYYRDASEVLVRDGWSRMCAEEIKQ